MKRKRVMRMISSVCIAAFAVVCLFGCTKQEAENAGSLPDREDGTRDENGETGGSTGEEEAGKNEDRDMSTGDSKGNLRGKADDGEVLRKAVNAFNWAYFDTLDRSGNLFYSPLSLSEALSMVLYGAKGNTAEEMKETLGVEDIETFLSDLKALAGGDYGSENTLIIANSLWADESFTENSGIKEDFLSGLEEKLDAEVRVTDFSHKSEASAKEISEWVSKKTEGFIGNYASGADENTVLDVINAIYFNGKWESEFMKEDTFEEEFRGGKRTLADMMHLYDGHFKYLEKDGFSGIELPYKESSLVMDIMMPEDNENLDAGKDWSGLEAEKREEFLEELYASEPSNINILAIPRFDMDITAEDLKGDLEKLGIRDAFDPSAADLSKIADRIYVSDIAHRAKIEVDEEGSRAAAVTEIEMAVTSVAPSSENRYFICDRPFVFVIKDGRTGVILFTGLVNSPD